LRANFKKQVPFAEIFYQHSVPHVLAGFTPASRSSLDVFLILGKTFGNALLKRQSGE
jgi:hypothetical protein